MYRSPSARQAYFHHVLDNIEAACEASYGFVILGDLNYDYKLNGTLASNPIYYLEHVQLLLCNQLITEATREPQSTKTILDVHVTVPDSHLKSDVPKCVLNYHNFVCTVMDGRYSEGQTRIVTFRKS